MELVKRAIVFTDLKDFTLRNTLLTHKQIDELIDVQKDIVEPLVTEFGWDIVKTIWDAYMVAFESVKSSLDYSKALHLRTSLYNTRVKNPLRQLVFRTTISYGTVNMKDSERGMDYFWDPVNISARMQDLIKEEGIFFDNFVFDQLEHFELKYYFIGKTFIRGILSESSLYQLPIDKDGEEIVTSDQVELLFEAEKLDYFKK